MSQKTQENLAAVTLDQAFKALQHWRANKKAYEGKGIPDPVWHLIFQLEDTNEYSDEELKRLFDLNSRQYTLKRASLRGDKIKKAPEIHASVSALDDNNPEINFCEATIAQEVPSLTDTKNNILKLKSSQSKPEEILDLATIIVECIRPDGQRLKIHTTNKNLDRIIGAFFQQEDFSHD